MADPDGRPDILAAEFGLLHRHSSQSFSCAGCIRAKSSFLKAGCAVFVPHAKCSDVCGDDARSPRFRDVRKKRGSSYQYDESCSEHRQQKKAFVLPFHVCTQSEALCSSYDTQVSRYLRDDRCRFWFTACLQLNCSLSMTGCHASAKWTSVPRVSKRA